MRRVSRLANESGHWNQLPGFECRVTSAEPHPVYRTRSEARVKSLYLCLENEIFDW
jgi:hypothetical protein